MNQAIQNAFTNFRQHFTPAYCIHETDEFLSTEEIFHRFNRLAADPELTTQMVHDWMVENGFRYDYIMDEFRWLLKIIEP